MTALPIDDHLPAIRAALASSRAVVVVAAPGAGKTTRVPPAIAGDGPVVVLQPRRLAARAVSRRIAEEQGWTAGREVGWHVRFDRRFGPETRVRLVTEGMLTAYLDDDPLLGDVATVVLDEFHERSVHTDIGLALVKQAWLARDDLRVVVMSATLDPGPVSAYLGHCPVVHVPGVSHPLAIEYAPGERVPEALASVLPRTAGHVLVFLPGAADIERTLQEASPLATRHEATLVPLHGSLDAESQDRALQPSSGRRIVLATNIAETSLTVPGVSTVIDTGLHKVARYDAARAIDALVLERVPQDSADQRAGRAARLGPGLARRLWDARDRLRPARDAEIHRVDLAGLLLGIIAAGNRPETFDWFEAPASERVSAALSLLERLGALDGGRATTLGHQLRRLPLHPRLGRVLLEADGAFEAAAACALLSEGRIASASGAATTNDLLPTIDRWPDAPTHVRQVAGQLQQLARTVAPRAARAHIDDEALRRALLHGYPDRVARRREPDRHRVVLASGRGAVMGRESRVVSGDWLIALDVSSAAAAGREAIVRLAAAVEPEWIVPTSTDVEHRFDATTGMVKALEILRYDAIVMREHHVTPDPDVRARLLAEAWLDRGPDEATRQLVARARFAGCPLDLPLLAVAAAYEARSVHDLDIAGAIDHAIRRRLENDAPEHLPVPSGRSARLDYRDDGNVVAAVKLQELFGLADTPRLGPARTPVTLELLAPNGRPVQTTQDLRSFWARTYPEVRRELRGRYPKHPWPEDPWAATPTHRTTRRR